LDVAGQPDAAEKHDLDLDEGREGPEQMAEKEEEAVHERRQASLLVVRDEHAIISPAPEAPRPQEMEGWWAPAGLNAVLFFVVWSWYMLVCGWEQTA
jgi:hypothetical protein